MKILSFFVKNFSATTWLEILKFGTTLDSDELYCVTNKQPHIAYQSLSLFIFFLSNENFNSFFCQQFLSDYLTWDSEIWYKAW